MNHKNVATRLMVGLLAAAGFWLTTVGPLEAKRVPPLTMTVTIDNPTPALNQNEILRIRLETTRSYSNLFVKITLPREIALVRGATEWSGALEAGDTRELQLLVSLSKHGRYSICVDAIFDPAESSFESSRVLLNVIADDREVMVSEDPFCAMDMRRARSAEERQRLLGAMGEETRTPAAPVEHDDLPFFGTQEEQGALPPQPAPESLLERHATTITVSGNMKYKDTADKTHPIRYAVVKVFHASSGGSQQIGQGFTAANGAYSVRAVSPVAKPNIYVCVFAQIANNLVARVGPNMNSVYYMQSAVYSNYSARTLTVSLTTGKPVRGSASDDRNARVFSVLDAVLQAAVDAYALRGNRFMPIIPIVYPVGGKASFYRESPLSIHILRFDALDWDIIMHEYGHFFADKGASYKIDTSMGGAHDGGTTIPVHGKNKGVRLAWSEGFATWFAIMSQIKPTQRFLGLPGVPNSGNRFYQDTEDANITDDLEFPNSNQGYAAENSIMAMLYDLCDNNVDKSADGLSRDYICIPPKTVWNIINSGNWDDVGKFYNKLCGLIGLNMPSLFAVSQLFAMNNIGPELYLPAEQAVVSSSISPVFQWIPNGDPTPGYAHNRFALIVANKNFANILAVKTDITKNYHQFKSDEWQSIVGRSDGTGFFQWAVLGYNNISPRMPAAGGLGHFLSNMQTFRVRAYHIRLRWDKYGADVDLHLRPPSGASYSGWRYSGDCAFYNRNPDWGVKGDSSDNPYLDRDATTKGTEENITLDKVTDPGTYKVLVHYYNDHYKGPTTAIVEIYLYGKRVAWSYRTLTNPNHGPSSGSIWVPFTFAISKAGNVSLDDQPYGVMQSGAEDHQYDPAYDKELLPEPESVMDFD